MPVARLVKAALERGLYLMAHWNVVMVVPPLTVTREEADEALAILDEVLSIADEYVTAEPRALGRGAGVATRFDADNPALPRSPGEAGDGATSGTA